MGIVGKLPENSDTRGMAPGDRGLTPSCAPRGVIPPRIIRSEELFAGGKLVVIDHAGEQYRLTITKNGKLILQK